MAQNLELKEVDENQFFTDLPFANKTSEQIGEIVKAANANAYPPELVAAIREKMDPNITCPTGTGKEAFVSYLQNYINANLDAILDPAIASQLKIPVGQVNIAKFKDDLNVAMINFYSILYDKMKILPPAEELSSEEQGGGGWWDNLWVSIFGTNKVEIREPGKFFMALQLSPADYDDVISKMVDDKPPWPCSSVTLTIAFLLIMGLGVVLDVKFAEWECTKDVYYDFVKGI